MASAFRVLRALQCHQGQCRGRLLCSSSSFASSSHASVCLSSHHLSSRLFSSRALSAFSKSHHHQKLSSHTTSRSLSSEPPKPPADPESSEDPYVGPGTWEEVYRGILSTQIKLVKVFSLSTSSLGLIAQPYIYQSALGEHLGLAVAVGSFVGFFTFVTPFLIHWISKKYVTDLHYDKARDTYLATTYTFFLTKRQLEFRVDDVHVPDVPGAFTTLYARSRPLFLDPNTFSHIEHYGRLMGYDKPIDFHLGSPAHEEERPGAEEKKERPAE